MSWIHHHRISEAAALAAHEYLQLGNQAQAHLHFEQAAESEELALKFIDPEIKSRTYSITAVSAVALWYKAGNYIQARLLATDVLGTSTLADFGRGQINDLLTKMGNAGVGAINPIVRKESVIGLGQVIEGTIVGSGQVHISGQFKGDVAIRGDLTIGVGARVTGNVHADSVVVSGELIGNIENARRVEITSGGSIMGDVTAGAVTLAVGARMRGVVKFGWTSYQDVHERTRALAG